MNLKQRIYLAGYAGQTISPILRRLFAGSKYHRAYISGRLFVHFENNTRHTKHTMPTYGPAL